MYPLLGEATAYVEGVLRIDVQDADLFLRDAGAKQSMAAAIAKLASVRATQVTVYLSKISGGRRLQASAGLKASVRVVYRIATSAEHGDAVAARLRAWDAADVEDLVEALSGRLAVELKELTAEVVLGRSPATASGVTAGAATGPPLSDTAIAALVTSGGVVCIVCGVLLLTLLTWDRRRSLDGTGQGGGGKSPRKIDIRFRDIAAPERGGAVGTALGPSPPRHRPSRRVAQPVSVTPFGVSLAVEGTYTPFADPGIWMPYAEQRPGRRVQIDGSGRRCPEVFGGCCPSEDVILSHIEC